MVWTDHKDRRVARFMQFHCCSEGSWLGMTEGNLTAIGLAHCHPTPNPLRISLSHARPYT